MVTKYNGVWKIHCPTSEMDALLKFLYKIDSKEEIKHQFCEVQREIIMKACYVPNIILFDDGVNEPQYSDEDRAVLDEVKFYKENYVEMISKNFAVAMRCGTISKEEKVEFDNYIQTLFGWLFVKERPINWSLF